MKIVNHLDFFWPTSDDWHPNCERDTVRVRVTTLSDGAVRVSVWGADDCGMERDTPNATPEMVQRQILWVTTQLPNPLTKEWLRRHGFVPA